MSPDKLSKFKDAEIVALSLLSCFLVFALNKTNSNIENFVKSHYKINVVRKAPIDRESENDNKIIFAPFGSASMGERIFLEQKMKNFLMENRDVYGVRDIDNEKTDDGNYGTGFLIDSGILATANHVIQPKKIIQIASNKDHWLGVNVLGDVHTQDVAFIRIYPSYFYNMIPVKSAEEIFNSFPKNKKEVPLEKVMVGMKCMAFGEPRVVIGELYSFNKESGEVSFLVHVDPEGCSGTAVYDMNGLVIGLFQSVTGIKGGALDIARVKKALDVFRAMEKKKEFFLSAKK